MPSSATITSFYNFSANTKARASQVNNNFDVFRGHIIPVDPNTATSINNTYDLGSTQWRWKNGYINNLFIGNTTSSFSIESDTSTGDVISFKKNGTNLYRTKGFAQTTTADYGQLASSPLLYGSTSGSALTVNINTTYTFLTLGTLSIKSSGNPIILSMADTLFANSIGSGFNIRNTITSAIGGFFTISRNGSLIFSEYQDSIPYKNNICIIDTSAPAGTNSYELAIKSSGDIPLTITYTSVLKFTAKEMIGL